MKYFESHEIPAAKLLPLIGEAVNYGVTGSTTYFIKSFNSSEDIPFLENSKGIFQAFTKGLLLRVFKNNSSVSIPIHFLKIKKFELLKGVETIDPIFLSPMWVLIKLGVRIEISRYFKWRIWEYGIEPTTLQIETQDYKIGLETNGYTFNSQEKFFHNFAEIKDLIIKSATQKST